MAWLMGWRVYRGMGFRRQACRAQKTVLRPPTLVPCNTGAEHDRTWPVGHSAAYQVLERGFMFADPLALRILGQDADDAIALAKDRPERRPLRLFIAMRCRFAEDLARRAIARGVRQILVLGALALASTSAPLRPAAKSAPRLGVRLAHPACGKMRSRGKSFKALLGAEHGGARPSRSIPN
jgi:hypothetical protein